MFWKESYLVLNPSANLLHSVVHEGVGLLSPLLLNMCHKLPFLQLRLDRLVGDGLRIQELLPHLSLPRVQDRNLVDAMRQSIAPILPSRVMEIILIP